MNGRRPRPWLRGSLTAILAALSLPVAARASLGTGVGASPITLNQPAHPGSRYQLPSLYVVNTGTEASDYAVHVARLSQGPQRDVPASWVLIAKSRFHLNPQQATMVPLSLVLPDDAPPGDYLTNLVAGTVPPGQGGGLALGAAAAGKLTFVITPSPGLSIPWPWPPWAYALIGFCLLLGGGFFLSRRSGIRIQIQRKP